MCQAYEGERQFLVHTEIQEIRKKWKDHETGKHRLTKEEIHKLCIQKLMLDER